MPTDSDYEFERLLEDAVKTILEAKSLTVNTQRGEAKLTTPRVEVQLILEGVREDSQDGNPNDGFFYRGFGARLTVATVSDRVRNGVQHPTNVGKVRGALANRGAFTAENLPGLTVNDIKLSGSDVAIDSDNNLDVTTDTYSIAFVFPFQ